MPNLLNVLRVALLSTKAESLAAFKKFEDAHEVLERLARLWGVALPSEKLTLEVNLVLAVVASHTGRKELAAAAALTAARQTIAPKSRLNFASKCHAVQFANLIFVESGGVSDTDQEEAFDKYMQTEVDRRFVSRNLAGRFPLA
ncbi:MAG: hypothetical protein CFE28_14985 [Alphaproteobacteria bacterium PA2]|nr:MAG: hypothetical protein CFE28_14985 [Alphaproteobacteria bacterium PA2]